MLFNFAQRSWQDSNKEKPTSYWKEKNNLLSQKSILDAALLLLGILSHFDSVCVNTKMICYLVLSRAYQNKPHQQGIK